MKFSKQIQIRLKTFDLETLLKIQLLLKEFASKYNFVYSSISLPVEIKRINVLKSPHVNKKARDIFETRFHNRLFILCGNAVTSDLLYSLKQLSLATVSLKVSLLSKNA